MNPFRIIVSGVIGDDGIADELAVEVNGVPDHAHRHLTAKLLETAATMAREDRAFQIGAKEVCPGCARKFGTGHLVNCPWVIAGPAKSN